MFDADYRSTSVWLADGNFPVTTWSSKSVFGCTGCRILTFVHLYLTWSKLKQMLDQCVVIISSRFHG